MFQKLKVDTSCIGLMSREDHSPYFCTPIGTQIIGRAGVDGIHYGFIEGFGEMVFVINPASCCEHYVYPLASNFHDFLRLVLAEKGTSTLEQIILWNKQQYLDYVNSPEVVAHSAQENVTSVMHAIQSLGITPMERPFEYVKNLQAQFDYSRLVFGDE